MEPAAADAAAGLALFRLELPLPVATRRARWATDAADGGRASFPLALPAADAAAAAVGVAPGEGDGTRSAADLGPLPGPLLPLHATAWERPELPIVAATTPALLESVAVGQARV